MISGAIIDMDGTLLDSMPVWEQASGRYLAGRGIEPNPGLSRLLFTMSMREGAAWMKAEFGLPESVGEIADGVNGVIRQAYEREIGPKEGAKDFLDAMRQRGIPMVVATATDREMTDAALRRTGLLPYFSKVFTCTEVGAGKGRPKIYLEAAAHLGTRIAETWVFEDALYAIETAGNAGFRVAAVYDPSRGDDWPKICEVADAHAGGLGEYCEKFESYFADWS